MQCLETFSVEFPMPKVNGPHGIISRHIYTFPPVYSQVHYDVEDKSNEFCMLISSTESFFTGTRPSDANVSPLQELPRISRHHRSFNERLASAQGLTLRDACQPTLNIRLSQPGALPLRTPPLPSRNARSATLRGLRGRQAGVGRMPRHQRRSTEPARQR